MKTYNDDQRLHNDKNYDKERQARIQRAAGDTGEVKYTGEQETAGTNRARHDSTGTKLTN